MEGRAAAVRGAAAGVLGDWRARERCVALLLGQWDWPRGYTRLCRATDQGAALPRGRALPRQRSAFLVAATSDLCRATMHGAAQAFDHARAIGAAKGVIFF